METNRGERNREPNNNSNKSEGTPVYLTSGSTLQSPEEHAHDQQVDAKADSTMEALLDDLNEMKISGHTGSNDIGNNHQ